RFWITLASASRTIATSAAANNRSRTGRSCHRSRARASTARTAIALRKAGFTAGEDVDPSALGGDGASGLSIKVFDHEHDTSPLQRARQLPCLPRHPPGWLGTTVLQRFRPLSRCRAPPRRTLAPNQVPAIVMAAIP